MSTMYCYAWLIRRPATEVPSAAPTQLLSTGRVIFEATGNDSWECGLAAADTSLRMAWGCRFHGRKWVNILGPNDGTSSTIFNLSLRRQCAGLTMVAGLDWSLRAALIMASQQLIKQGLVHMSHREQLILVSRYKLGDNNQRSYNNMGVLWHSFASQMVGFS